ncbi:TetR/AcrR family transcriptional regulator [Microbispora bryophytorum]|jgi:AcrR family transcriptional regulator|uniref:TetR/AcrR family transcriptional regulator n=1 Tax=Microbispora bryophytorum TaxID=1460882 RepID=UPI001CC311F9|nr:TetR/AcrR family transcriptional regulator [Microbispora camponoti]
MTNGLMDPGGNRRNGRVPSEGTIPAGAGRELPVLDLEPGPPAPVRERADAARNRMRVLKAAEQLFATRDARHVTMDEIAKAAGVGRATLYRRYPDPASIATALLDEHERQVQGHILNGPPPLGPGACPADRLAAFYVAMIDLLERHLHLVLGAEIGSARFGTGAYRFWRAHVRMLMTEARVPDPEGMADAALAPLAPEVYQFQRHTLGLSQARITEALVWSARRLAGG